MREDRLEGVLQLPRWPNTVGICLPRLGLYAAFLTGWMVLDLPGALYIYGTSSGLTSWNPMSEVFFTTSGSGVLLDVVKTALIRGFGVWLVPRTIGVHSGLVRRNAALASRVTRLAETGFLAGYRAGERRGLRRVAVSRLDRPAAGVADGNPAAPDEHF